MLACLTLLQWLFAPGRLCVNTCICIRANANLSITLFPTGASELRGLLEHLGPLGASWSLLEQKFILSDPSRRFGPSRTSWTPRKAAQAAQTGLTGFPSPQAAQTGPQDVQTVPPGRPDSPPRTSRQSPQDAQTVPPGRPDSPPRPPRQAARPLKEAPQAAPAAGTASRNALVDKTWLLSSKPCSCRHCCCRQRTAFWPFQTGPSRPHRLPGRQDRPPRPFELLEQPPGMLLSTKQCSCRQHLARVDKNKDATASRIAPADKTCLLSAKLCSCRRIIAPEDTAAVGKTRLGQLPRLLLLTNHCPCRQSMAPVENVLVLSMAWEVSPFLGGRDACSDRIHEQVCDSSMLLLSTHTMMDFATRSL